MLRTAMIRSWTNVSNVQMTFLPLESENCWLTSLINMIQSVGYRRKRDLATEIVNKAGCCKDFSRVARSACAKRMKRIIRGCATRSRRQRASSVVRHLRTDRGRLSVFSLINLEINSCSPAHRAPTAIQFKSRGWHGRREGHKLRATRWKMEIASRRVPCRGETFAATVRRQ